LVPAFQEHYRIVLFDLVGAGKSDLSAYSRTKYGSLSGYAADVVEICDELSLSRVIFAGHSVSAMIGALAVVRQPSLFERLVMIGPSPCYLNDGDYTGGFSHQQIEELLDAMDDNYMGWSSGMAPLIMGNSDRPALSRELVDSFCRTDPAIARHFARVFFLADNRAELAAVSVPSLILQCADDVIAPRAVGEYMHSQLKDSTLVFMTATGHCPHLSDPGETIAAIRRFLSPVARAAARSDSE
jgi:sigma-B regulation protein RsbQ